jgi:hypothetical protein
MITTRRPLTAGLVAAAALATMLVIPAQSLAQRPTESAGPVVSSADPLTVVLRLAQYHDVDVPPRGDSVGDVTAFSDRVLQDGQQVGIDGATCTTTNVAHDGSGSVLCVANLFLPPGQISIQGLMTFTASGPDKTAAFAITGGTGAYRNARGDALLTNLPNDDIQVDLNITG